MRHTKNLGYGGNQKAGYALAAEHGLDIIVLLHGDGQYAPPELLPPEMVAPIERGECEAVFGSRMMTSGSALKGGMPVYKWLGNRILTRLENGLLGSDLTEFHSGYRAYSVAASSGCRSTGTPTLRLRHPDHRAAAQRGHADQGDPPSPRTTATRSATSTA